MQPQETAKKLIAKKFANALIKDAALSEDAFAVITRLQRLSDSLIGRTAYRQPPIRDEAEAVGKFFKKRMGGFWVGGTLSLFEDSLHFEANALNEALQTGLANVDIALTSVVRVTPRFGFVTGIIDVAWTKDSMQYLNSFRCFGSKKFIARITDAVKAAHVNA